MKFAIYLNICAIVMSPIVIFLAYFQFLPSNLVVTLSVSIFFAYTSVYAMLLYLKITNRELKVKVFKKHKWIFPFLFGLYYSTAGISMQATFRYDKSSEFFLIIVSVFSFVSGIYIFYSLRFMIRILLKYGVIRKFY